jgi:iron complex outermembrane recepter protein
MALVIAGLAPTVVFANAGVESSTKSFQIDIGRLPLSDALMQFAEQTQIQFASFSDVGASHTLVGPLSGNLNATAALTRLLNGTGLTFRFVNARTVAILREVTVKKSPPAEVSNLSVQPPAGAADGAQDAPVENRVVNEEPVKHRSFFARMLSLFTVCTAATIASNPACAQSANQTAVAAQADDLMEIVVTATGTSIRGVAPVGSNLVTFTREDVVSSGAATTHDVIAAVPQLGLFNQSQFDGVSGARDGIQTPSLRGLGPQATLSLVNGHRLVGAGILANSFDPDVIPAAALERVEVVADGASAIYGSDAVAGVVNFITRQNFTGAETSLRYGLGSSYHDEDFSQLFGKAWSTGSAMLVYEYSLNSAVQGKDRPAYYQPLDQRPFGGNDERSTNCPLANVTLTGSPVVYAAPNFAPNTVNYCDSTGPADLLWAKRRNSVFGTVRQEITDSISAWADGSYSARHTDGRQVALNATATISDTNPFFQPIPGSNATSENVAFRADNLTGSDSVIDTADASSANVVAGFDFKLPHQWGISAYGTYGSAKTTAQEPIALNTDLLNAAAAGTTTATALDPFGTGTNPAVAAGIVDWNYYNHSTQTLTEGDVKADGPVFLLPGGEVKLAVGGSYRRETFDADFHQGPTHAPSTFNDATATRTVKSAYTEVFVPLFGKPNALPGLQSLDLSLAGRFDDYSDFGSTKNPKYGINWTPLEGLTLRGSYGKSFHAPNLSDLHAIDGKVVTVGASPITNVIVGNDPQTPLYNAVVLAGGNPSLNAERAKTYSFGVDWAPLFLSGLKTSLTYFNVAYSDRITVPPFGNGSSAIFTDPAYAPFIYRNAPPDLIAALGAGLPQVVLLPSNPAFPTTLLDLRRQNLSVSDIDGVDFDFSYRWDSRFGNMLTGVVGQRTLKYENQGTVNSPAADQLQLGTAKWLARGRFEWRNYGVDSTIFVNYSGAYQNVVSVGPALASYTASAYTTVDWHVGYTLPASGFTKGTVVSIDAEDLFDKNPGMTPAGPRTNVNVMGRTIWFGIRKNW